MFTLTKKLRAAFTRTAPLTKKRIRLGVEALEERWVPANLDYTQVAMDHGVHHTNPSHLYLNFDGDNGKFAAYQNGAQTDQDIQDILYRVSEIYAPFNVEVTRINGAGNSYQGNDGSTTLFVGPSSADVDSNGTKYTNSFTPPGQTDSPGIDLPSDHQPDSLGHHVAYCDPFGAGGAVDSTETIAGSIAHEAGHTFGLAHVRTDGLTDPMTLGVGTVGDIMSYNVAAGSTGRTYFANTTLPITTANYNPAKRNDGKGGISFSSDEQPSWVSSSIWTPFGSIRLSSDPITQQNSYSYLSTVLGTRPVDGVAHVADNDAIDPSIRFRLAAHTPIGANAPVAGSITRDGDYDVYMVQQGTSGKLYLYAATTGGNLTPTVMVHDANDNLQTLTADGANGYDVNVQAGQLYFVIIGGHDGQGAGNYQLNVESNVTAKNGELDITVPGVSNTVSLTTNGVGGVHALVNGTATDYAAGEVTSVYVSSNSPTAAINLQATPAGMTTNVYNLVNNVNLTVGNNGSLAGIAGPVNVSNTSGKTSVTVDDSADGSNQSATVTNKSVTFQGVAQVNYGTGVTSLAVKGGTGTDNFQIDSTAAATPLTLFTGQGTNNVFIGEDRDTISQAGTFLQTTSHRHSLADIAGLVSIQSNSSGKTSVVVDDSAEAGRTVNVNGGSVAFAGSPLIIYNNITSLTVVTGAGSQVNAAVPSSGPPLTVYGFAGSTFSGATPKTTFNPYLPFWDNDSRTGGVSSFGFPL